MSASEGKNCFRRKWSNEPTYSGGPIRVIEVFDGLGSRRHAVALANRSVVNLVDANTGELLAQHLPILEDDIVLHLDACSLAPSSTEQAMAKEVEIDDASGDEGAASSTTSPNNKTKRNFIAFSTRSLQITVLEAFPVLPTLVKPEVSKKSSKKAASKNAEASSMDLDEFPFELRVVKQWTASQHAVGCLRFSPDGQYLASGSTDGNVKVWNVEHHHLTHNFRCQGGIVTSIAFSLPDSGLSSPTEGQTQPVYLGAGSFEGYVTVWRMEEKNQAGVKRVHNSPIEGLFLYDSGRIVTIGRDRKIARCAEVTMKGEIKETVITEHVGSCLFRLVSPQAPDTVPKIGMKRARGADEDAVELHLHIGAQNGALVTYSIPAQDTIGAIRRRAPIAGDTGDTKDDEEMPEEGVRSISFIPTGDVTDGESIMTADGATTLHWLDLPKGQKTYEEKHKVVCSLDQVLDVKMLAPSLTPNAAVVEEGKWSRLVLTNSHAANIFRGRGCVCTESLVGHSDVVMSASISTDGKWIVTGSKDKSLRVWSTHDLLCYGVGTAHLSEVIAVDFIQRITDNTALIGFSVSTDSSLKVWDFTPCRKSSQNGEVDAVLKPSFAVDNAHDGGIHCLAVAPNDAYVATGGKDKAINLWGLKPGKKVLRETSLKGHKRSINSVVFSKTEKLLASASNDGTVKIWSLVTFVCAKTLQVDRSGVIHADFFNRGAQLVTAGGDGLLRVWALGTSDCVASVETHNDKIWALSVIEDDAKGETYFVTGSADGEIVVVEDYTAEEAQRLKDLHHQTIEEEQNLANAIRTGNWPLAFRIALQLAHPRHLRSIVGKWLAKAPDSIEGEMAIEIRKLKQDRREKLLEFARGYVANARYSNIAAVIVKSFLSAFPLTEITKMSDVQRTLEAIWSYSRRHHCREKTILQQLQYVNYVCRSVIDTPWDNSGLTAESRHGDGEETEASEGARVAGRKSKRHEEDIPTEPATTKRRASRLAPGAADEESLPKKTPVASKRSTASKKKSAKK